MGLKEIDLSNIAQTRLGDAQALLSGNRFDGAVYLAGYVIELALKAKIVAVHNFDFPESDSEKKQTFPFNGKNIKREKLWTHNLSELACYITISDAFVFKTLLGRITTWGPTNRYKIGMSGETAQDFLNTVNELYRRIQNG